MSRTVEISLPTHNTDVVLEQIRDAKGVLGVTLHRGAGLKPPDDILVLHTTNEGLQSVQSLLARCSIGDSASVLTSEPRSLTSPSHQAEIDQESNEATWSEMAALLRSETNVSSNYLMAMFFSAIVAAVRLWTDTLHLVIGAMVIAPGFEPIIRIPFGVLGERHAWKNGLKSTLAGYGVIVLGAAAAVAVMGLLDPAAEARIDERYWVQYWSSVKPASIMVALAAGAAGAAIIAAQRSVLSAGVMIALALIPSASIAGMAIASGEFALAGRGLIRWTIDAISVIVAGGGVFLVKRRHA